MPYPTRRRQSPRPKKSRAELAAEFAALPLEALGTRTQAAAYMGVSDALLERWAWSGDGPPMARIGRAVRYRRSDIDEYVAARRVRSTSDAGAGGA